MQSYKHSFNSLLLLQVAYPEQDVVVITAFRNLSLSWANLPASVTVMFRWFLMSCVHLLLGLPRTLLPGTIPSIMVFSKLSWRLIWFPGENHVVYPVFFYIQFFQDGCVGDLFDPLYSEDFSVILCFKCCYFVSYSISGADKLCAFSRALYSTLVCILCNK